MFAIKKITVILIPPIRRYLFPFFILLFLVILFFSISLFVDAVIPPSCRTDNQVRFISLSSNNSSVITISNYPSYASNVVAITGVLKFGQTLIIDGIESSASSSSICTGVIGAPLLCPGSTVIVKNSNVRTLQLATFNSAPFAQCNKLCEFPPGIDETNIPVDTDPRYLVNVSIFNNVINQVSNNSDDALLFAMDEDATNCTAFNNTRYVVQIYNNRISNYYSGAIRLSLGNYVRKSNSSLVRMKFFRNSFIRNNTMYLMGLDPPVSPDRRAVVVASMPSEEVGPSVNSAFYSVGAEGTFDFSDNYWNQECKDHLLAYFTNSVVNAKLTTFGANPDHLPLLLTASNNQMFGSKNAALLRFQLLHSRVGYLPSGYTFTKTDPNFVQTKNPQLRNDIFDIVPPELAPRAVVENNLLVSENGVVAQLSHITVTSMIDDRSPDIRQFVKSLSTSSLDQSNNNNNNNLYLLMWYPERQIFGSVVIRNNILKFSLPMKPITYWYSGKGDSAGTFDGPNRFVIVQNFASKMAENATLNLGLPVNRLNGQILPSSQTLARNNQSSYMFALENVTIENNNFTAINPLIVTYILLSNMIRVQSLIVRSCSFFSDINQDPSNPRASYGQYLYALEFQRYSTLEFVSVTECSWTTFKPAKNSDGFVYRGAYISLFNVFGVVAIIFERNQIFSRISSMSANCEFINIFSNHYTSSFDFATSTSTFAPQYQFRHLHMDASSEGLSQSNHNLVIVRSLILPGGTILFDNLTIITRTIGTSAAISTQSPSLIECDRFIVSNVHYLSTGLKQPRAVDVNGATLFVRKEMIVTNITYVVRPIKYGSYLVYASGAVDFRQVTAVYITASFNDMSAWSPESSDSFQRPPYYQHYQNPSPSETINGAVADKPMYLEISNIFARIESGIASPGGGIFFIGKGINCRSPFIKNNNNNNNDVINNNNNNDDDGNISIHIKNVTLYAGAPDGNESVIPRDNIGARLAVENAAITRYVAALMVWPRLTWKLKMDFDINESTTDDWLQNFEPRINQMFPDSSSLSMKAPQNFIVEGVEHFADARATSQMVAVVLADVTSERMFAEAIIPVTPNTLLPPNIFIKDSSSQSAIITATYNDNGASTQHQGVVYNWTEAIRKPELDFSNAVSFLNASSSFLHFRQLTNVNLLQMENVFAPLFRNIWLNSFKIVSASSGLNQLIILPAAASSSSNFMEKKYLEFIQNFNNHNQKNNNNNIAETSIGTCGVFVGVRPLSSEERVLSSMSMSTIRTTVSELDGATSPFNKKPLPLYSQNFYDQIHFSPCLTQTKTSSQSRTRREHNRKNTKTKTFSLSKQDDDVAKMSKNVVVVSSEVASVLAANDYTQTASTVALAVFGSVASSPTLGFTIGRQQVMTNFAKKALLEGDCRGLLPPTVENHQEENEMSNPLGFADSPTQMSIGGHDSVMGFYAGAVVGNFILIVSLVLLSQGIGMIVIKIFKLLKARQFYDDKNKNNLHNDEGRRLTNRSFRMKHSNDHAAKRETFWSQCHRAFAASYVSLTLFFCLSFLLSPTLSSALVVLVAAKNDPNLEVFSTGLKVFSVFLAFIFCVVAVTFVLWSVQLRKQRREQCRPISVNASSKNKQQPKKGSNLMALMTYLLKSEVEWKYPNPIALKAASAFNNFSFSNKVSTPSRTEKRKSPEKKAARSTSEDFEISYLNFLIAEPTFESYRNSTWFALVEIVTAISIAFPSFFAQFANSGKSSCLVQGIMLLVILVVYFVILVWKNPFKIRMLRIMNPILALQQIVIVTMVLIGVATSEESANHKSPSLLWKVIPVSFGFEGMMGVLTIAAAFFPLLLFLRKMKSRMQGSNQNIVAMKDAGAKKKIGGTNCNNTISKSQNHRRSLGVEKQEEMMTAMNRRNKNYPGSHHNQHENRSNQHNNNRNYSFHHDENDDHHQHHSRRNYNGSFGNGSFTNNNNNNDNRSCYSRTSPKNADDDDSHHERTHPSDHHHHHHRHNFSSPRSVATSPSPNRGSSCGDRHNHHRNLDRKPTSVSSSPYHHDSSSQREDRNDRRGKNGNQIKGKNLSML